MQVFAIENLNHDQFTIFGTIFYGFGMKHSNLIQKNTNFIDFKGLFR